MLNDMEVTLMHTEVKVWAPVFRKKMYHVPTSVEVMRVMVRGIQEVHPEYQPSWMYTGMCWLGSAHHV